jgi:transcriptional regulator with XRE-family HTH domain
MLGQHRPAKRSGHSQPGAVPALADATAGLGYPITRSQIANYESGRKQSLDVAELMVLAAVLDVAPLELLFPGKASHPVERLPGSAVTTSDAISWFTGNWGWLYDLHSAVDQLAQVLRPAGIRPSEQFGAPTVTQTEPPTGTPGEREKVALGAIAHKGETQ